jgi:hypothetical protein
LFPTSNYVFYLMAKLVSDAYAKRRLGGRG